MMKESMIGTWVILPEKNFLDIEIYHVGSVSKLLKPQKRDATENGSEHFFGPFS